MCVRLCVCVCVCLWVAGWVCRCGICTLHVLCVLLGPGRLAVLEK